MFLLRHRSFQIPHKRKPPPIATSPMSDKRKRSPSPEKKPIAPGVEYKGFLLQSDRILRKFKDNKEKRLEETNFMLESAGEHILENSGGIQDNPFNWTVQFVHTLLEVAAAVTSAAAFDGEDWAVRS